jgi:phosphoglycerate dehydrogenase-like enzyme
MCVESPQAADLLTDRPDGVEVLVWDGGGEPPPQAAEVEFLVAPYPLRRQPAELVATLPNLKVVQLLSAGVDAWLDTLPAGVVLCRGVGVHVNSTADLALALTLAAGRQLPIFVRQQAEHRWHPIITDELADRRVLIVGAGEIGQAIGRRIEACDARVTLVARTARDGRRGTAELAQLLPEHDVVILIVPLTDETRGMVDAAFLAAMADNALLVNVARGAVVVTDALVAELTAGRLRAALDVTDPEPLPAEHPLWTTPNTLITPHVGGGTSGWLRRGYQLVSDQLQRYVAGAPLDHVVTGRY